MIRSCIVGPTAAGKSALAMQLAEARQLAIVSADSRQIYRGFDIGTAKPSPEERERVPHFGIDVADPAERYSAHAWATAAQAWMHEARALGRTPVIVGGTGLYVRALIHPLAEVPVLEPERRAQLHTWLSEQSLSTLQQWCRRLDPARAHLGRTQLLRAIETALLAGVRQSAAFDAVRDSSRDTDTGRSDTPVGGAVRYLVVDPGPALADRIAARVRAMAAAGFVDEVARLRQQVPLDAPAWKASGYGAVLEAVDGHCSLHEAMERVIIETRQYAKRQRTWNRHQLPAAQVTHVDPTRPDAVQQTLAWWDAGAEAR